MTKSCNRKELVRSRGMAVLCQWDQRFAFLCIMRVRSCLDLPRTVLVAETNSCHHQGMSPGRFYVSFLRESFPNLGRVCGPTAVKYGCVDECDNVVAAFFWLCLRIIIR